MTHIIETSGKLKEYQDSELPDRCVISFLAIKSAKEKIASITNKGYVVFGGSTFWLNEIHDIKIHDIVDEDNNSTHQKMWATFNTYDNIIQVFPIKNTTSILANIFKQFSTERIKPFEGYKEVWVKI